MKTSAEKAQDNRGHAAAARARNEQNQTPASGFVDNRAEAIQMKMLMQIPDNSARIQYLAQLKRMANEHAAKQEPPVQKTPNHTGLPDNLKSGIENLSGYSMDDVKVHYNSEKPAQLQALAYTQGTDIHVAPGQEQHLPHEAWHVVQQKEGRVKPTLQLKDGVNVNDDAGLEKEADDMGAEALLMKMQNNNSRHITNKPQHECFDCAEHETRNITHRKPDNQPIVQREISQTKENFWKSSLEPITKENFITQELAKKAEDWVSNHTFGEGKIPIFAGYKGVKESEKKEFLVDPMKWTRERPYQGHGQTGPGIYSAIEESLALKFKTGERSKDGDKRNDQSSNGILTHVYFAATMKSEKLLEHNVDAPSRELPFWDETWNRKVGQNMSKRTKKLKSDAIDDGWGYSDTDYEEITEQTILGEKERWDIINSVMGDGGNLNQFNQIETFTPTDGLKLNQKCLTMASLEDGWSSAMFLVIDKVGNVNEVIIIPKET